MDGGMMFVVDLISGLVLFILSRGLLGLFVDSAEFFLGIMVVVVK
jgi:hypothetical protein